jgi:hypothetical protein
MSGAPRVDLTEVPAAPWACVDEHVYAAAFVVFWLLGSNALVACPVALAQRLVKRIRPALVDVLLANLNLSDQASGGALRGPAP